MAGNGAIETFEVERKYAVSSRAELPGSPEFTAVGLRLLEPENFTLEAIYFDTPDATLGIQRVAVRKRVGGKDEGWHMKLKGADGSRELAWPLAETMPDGLLREIVDRIGKHDADRLIAVATMPWPGDEAWPATETTRPGFGPSNTWPSCGTSINTSG